MFNQFEPTVKATIAFLKLFRVKVNNDTVNDTLQNHPDWPSLLCITDSLQKWNIPNAVGKIDTNKLDELPLPFMAYTYDKGNPLAIVTNITDTTIETYQKKYNKAITEPKESFIKRWEGVYLIAEPNENSVEPNYIANKQKAFFKNLVPAFTIATLIIFSFIILKSTTGTAPNSIGIYLQYAVLVIGTVVTSLLLWYEIDKNNPLLQKVCTGISKGDCNAILTGKAAKVFSWLSWSEVGFFYFTGSLLSLLFMPNAINILAWLNIVALPYTIFSVYYQWRVAKQWCVLCLAVQALFVVGALNVFASNFLSPLNNLAFLQITYCLLLFAIPALFWYSIKPFILKLQENKTTKRQYLRLKFNAEIFETLLKKQKQINTPIGSIGIDIGNSNATNEIIKVCNPYCGPCATVHPKLDALLEQNKNIKAKVIFTTPNDENNKGIKPVKHLLAIASENDADKTKQALDDWYLPNEKNYETFATKHKMNGELGKQGNKIELMNKWCKETGITFTPTIFINGYQLPDAYSIEDVEYFLQE
jgi:uncharacterized membrane protein/thiol-disulfide isomerase/thioredoxin